MDGTDGRTIIPHQVSGKEQNGGEVISISGCDDHQNSADTAVISCLSFCFNHFVLLVSCPWFLVSRNSTNYLASDMDSGSRAEVTSIGAMTFSFIQTIERGAGATYGSLLNAIRNAVHNADTEIDGAPLTTLLLTGGSEVRSLTQEPQLSSSEAFDVYSKPFYL
ncbi:hypothetical protein EJ110_NYTH36291 [Nymphaea thermarum]|nr:hypothetical protein EJ110_NYTH36291 [Nymphaea thermarum]